MTLFDNKTLKGQADGVLHRAGEAPRRLVLLHTGVSIGLAMLLLLLDHFLSQGIEQTGGLAGIGLRSILQTVRQTLMLANLVLLPFWEQGIRRLGLSIWREEPISTKTLTEGFRRFGPLLRLTILRMLIVFVLTLLCSHIAGMVLMLTPVAGELMEQLMPYAEQMSADPMSVDMQAILQAIPEDVITRTSIVVAVIMGVLMAVTCLPVLYLFRLADLAVLDRPGTGARKAMVLSFRAVKRQPLRLLKLDLSYWWYYALEALCILAGYSDVILKELNITLPIGEQAAFFGAYAVYGVGIFALYLFARAKVETSYAGAYDLMKADIA